MVVREQLAKSSVICPLLTIAHQAASHCVGSNCMMWVRVDEATFMKESDRRGMCGLIMRLTPVARD